MALVKALNILNKGYIPPPLGEDHTDMDTLIKGLFVLLLLAMEASMMIACSKCISMSGNSELGAERPGHFNYQPCHQLLRYLSFM